MGICYNQSRIQQLSSIHDHALFKQLITLYYMTYNFYFSLNVNPPYLTFHQWIHVLKAQYKNLGH